MKGTGDRDKNKKSAWFDADGAIAKAQRLWREGVDSLSTKLCEVIEEGDERFHETHTKRDDEYYKGPFKLLESRLVACKAVHTSKVSLSQTNHTCLMLSKLTAFRKLPR